MRILWFYLVVATCFAGFGCRLTHNVLQTTVVEPLQYSRDVYEKLARKRFIEMGEYALAHAISLERASRDDYECDPFTVDYQSGFVDGFVDYLEAGGTGEPPMLPPRRYWRSGYQSLDGHRAAEEWFEGYRHGAETARLSSYRSLVTVPLSDAIVSDTLPYTYGRIQAVNEADAGPSDPDESGDSDDESSSVDNVVDAENEKSRDAGPGARPPRVSGEPDHEVLKMYERISRLPRLRQE